MSKAKKTIIIIMAALILILATILIGYIINDFIETRTPDDFSLEHGNI